MKKTDNTSGGFEALPQAKCFLLSLGCPKNRVDSEWVKSQLQGAGHVFVDDPQEAQLILINTCGFIQEAVEESVDAILEAYELQKEDPDKRVIVLGCLPQRYGEKLAQSLPEVDLFVGCSELDRVVGLIDGGASGRTFVTESPSFVADGPFVRSSSIGPHSVYIKVAEGCNRSCAFCTVPSIRGPGRSRPLDDVYEEVEQMVASGVREVNLVAQDLTAYGTDRDDREENVDLVVLLQTLSGIQDLKWIRPLYLYPSSITHRVLQIMASIESVVPYVDVPFQHVSQPVLEAMDRGYGSRTVNRLMERIRKLWPQAFVRSTLLVGHPGETPQAFRELEDFVKRWKLEHLGVFVFSPEKGTPAAELLRPPLEEAQERRGRIMELQQSISAKKQETFLGKVITVLCDGPSQDSEHIYKSRHAGQAPEIDGLVYITEDRRQEDGAPRLKAGDWLDVEVMDSGDYDLVAAVVSDHKIST